MYGRIRLDGNADSQDRTNHMTQDHKFHFKAKQSEPEERKIEGHVCPGCQLRRTPREFQGIGETFRNCKSCRDRGASRETR